MASKNSNQPGMSSKAPLVVLIAGSLAVAALVGWALVRSMEAPTPMLSGTTVETPPSTLTAPITAEPAHLPDAEHAAVPRMTIDELKAKMDRGEVTVIDVRDADSFSKGHIPGALHIPLSRVEGEVDYLPKAKQIVFYCT